MGYTNFPNGLTSFGVPLPAGGSFYAGWWGTDIWYVDDENGSDTANTGKEPEDAFKTLQKAITSAGMHDTIFMKPREIETGATHSAHGYYTGTNIIPADRTGLAIIGTGRGIGLGSSVQCMIEPDASSGDEAITVRSVGVTIENVGVKAISSSNGGIFASLADGNAYGLTISNCFFKDYISDDGLHGSIDLDTIHWTTIQHCYFTQGGIGINHSSAITYVSNPVIKDCDFTGAAAKWEQDIYMQGTKEMVIDNCRFAHGIPTGGVIQKYINCASGGGGEDTGMISNCYFSAPSTVTVAHCMTLSGAIYNVHCYADGAILDT